MWKNSKDRKDKIISFKKYTNIVGDIAKKLKVSKDKAVNVLIKAQERGINPLKWQQNISLLSTFAAIVAEYDPTVEERDYKDEYKKFQSSEKMRKYRAELNRYNRKKGTYGNGDGKDASHKDGKIVGMEDQSINRGRAEKSRLIGSKRK